MDVTNKQKLIEVNGRLLDSVQNLEPGTEEYDKTYSRMLEGLTIEIENDKVENAHAERKSESRFNFIGNVLVGGVFMLAAIPLDYIFKTKLVNKIGTVEQIESFTSSAGRSFSSWFGKKLGK